MSVITRVFQPELEIRSRAQGGDGRTIVGVAVPFGRPQRITAQLTEQFARGAFAHQLAAAHRVPFARDHIPLGGTLIGRTVELREDAAGLIGAWRVSQTPAGDETLELVRDGVLSHLSIGFRTRQGGNRRLDDGTIERTRADLREVAVVLEGAYAEGALISGVRAAAGEDLDDGECTCGARRRLDLARDVLAGLPVFPSV